MPPKLAELITYCQERGIKGSYSVRHDPPLWRAKVKAGQVIFDVPADTRDAALERAAETALEYLTDPQPVPGTDAYVTWKARRAKRG